MPPNDLIGRLPKYLSLSTVLQALKREDGKDVLAQLLKSTYGHLLGEALTVESVIDLLWQFGIFAPIGEWLPPVGASVKHFNIYMALEPGTTQKLRFCGSSQKGRIRKFKDFVVTPTNVTAEDSVNINQTIFATDLYPLGWITGSQCGPRETGNFTTLENLNLQSGTEMILEVENTDTESTARIHIEAVAWEVP